MLAIVNSISTVLCLACVIGTVVPFLRVRAGLVRLFDFPRVQILLGGSLGLVGLVASSAHQPDRVSLVLGLLTVMAAGWQLAMISPYTPLAAHQVPAASPEKPRARVDILVANIKATNREVERLLELAGRLDPDIVLLVEVTSHWARELQRFAARYPYVLAAPRDDKFGIMLLTRLEMRDGIVRQIVQPNVPSIKARMRLASGFEFAFYGLHPRPPLPGQSSHSRDIELLHVAEEVSREAMPAIVCGDLNDVAWSWTTRRFLTVSGLLDPRIGRGVFATFHADYWFARWPLDHLFHSRDFTLVRLAVEPHIGSDHFPIYCRLQVNR